MDNFEKEIDQESAQNMLKDMAFDYAHRNTAAKKYSQREVCELLEECFYYSFKKALGKKEIEMSDFIK